MSRVLPSVVRKRIRSIDRIAMAPEEKIWASIREFGTSRMWRFSDLADGLTVNRATVRDYVFRLARGGFLTRTADGRYQLTRDNGIERPQLRKNGEPIPMSNREKMWLAMEGMRNFSVHDLAFVTAVPVIDIKSYIGYLAHVGILRLVEASKPGKVARYTLLRWTGPKPMQIRRDKSVFDPNTGQEYPAPGPNVKLVRRTMVPLPDWILKLAERCDEEGQGRVATQIGYSKSVISQVLSGKYTGRIDWVEQAVVKHLISIEWETVSETGTGKQKD
ncbi:MAG: hypothetical protein HQL74_06010 [Magnetococcales bacterium]|nr:hypothetical protein [Magnetococcales bacterium]